MKPEAKNEGMNETFNERYTYNLNTKSSLDINKYPPVRQLHIIEAITHIATR